MSRILITGGTGSLGRALVSHWLKNTEHRLIVFSRDEWKQSQMREEFPDGRLDFFLGDVRDADRLALAFQAQVDVVIHAAAFKRVDALHRDPDELLKTNILGSRSVLHAARGRVKQCLLISSDKACYPTNAYGRSKGVAEDLFTQFNVYSTPQGTLSAVVRYGNVLGSRGSVVPLWRSRIAQGLPLELTDPRMTRFLITFPQAIQLIETALATMQGGEIFVPRLRKVNMTELYGALAGPEYPLKIVGKRPGGEKLHEVMLTREEAEITADMGDYVEINPKWSMEGVQPEAFNSEWAQGFTPEELEVLLGTI